MADAEASVAKLITSLSQQIHGSGSLAAQITNAQQQYGDARSQVRIVARRQEETRPTEKKALDQINAPRGRTHRANSRWSTPEQQQQLQEDLHVRLLRAEGFTTEAERARVG